MSATIWDWIFQTATSSGRRVAQPSGPGGRAMAPAVVAARAAAELAMARARSAGLSLTASSLVVGTFPINLRMASAILPTDSSFPGIRSSLLITTTLLRNLFQSSERLRGWPGRCGFLCRIIYSRIIEDWDAGIQTESLGDRMIGDRCS